MGVGQIVVGWLGWRSCWGGRVIDGYIGGSRDTGRTKRGVYELLIVYGDALATFTKMARILGFHLLLLRCALEHVIKIYRG